jgi:hypothetical protein
MKKYILPIILILLLSLIIYIYSSNIEGFQDIKMRPWFGYEPGYGPGWGRKGCCN